MSELIGFYHYMFRPEGTPWYTGGFYGNQTQWTIMWLPTLIVIYRKRFECCKRGCWRLGHYQVEKTHYKTCPKHTTKIVHDRLLSDHKRKNSAVHEFIHNK